MKTSKAFSTISYNTTDFLIGKLDELVQRRVISFYAFVRHYKEEDEKKDHIHLFIEPNGLYQTDALTDFLQEPDFSDLLKPPLGIMPCKSSKFGDWYLYSSHDTAYLASKGQARHFHYDLPDFKTSNEDYLLELVHTIDRSPYKKTQDFVKLAKKGVPFLQLVEDGQVPAPQFTQWSQLYSFVQQGSLQRAGRSTHTPKQVVLTDNGDFEYRDIDPETGEVIEDSEV